jgi:glyoxylase-like metal-dependent hydrolase (beta-lactamase superfamily II)
LPERGVLFVGDALQRRFGRLGLPSRLFTADMAAARASVQRLAQVDFGTLCFSHFAAVGASARAELGRLAAAVA